MGGSFPRIPVTPMLHTKGQCGTAVTAWRPLSGSLRSYQGKGAAPGRGWQQGKPNALRPTARALTPASRDRLPPVTPSVLLPPPICFSTPQYFTPFSCPAPGQFKASPGFPWRQPAPAQELCGSLCHEQQPPREVVSLLPSLTWKNLHIALKRCCKHFKEPAVS